MLTGNFISVQASFLFLFFLAKLSIKCYHFFQSIYSMIQARAFLFFYFISEIYAFIHKFMTSRRFLKPPAREEQNMGKDLQEKGYLYASERFADLINGVVCGGKKIQ